MKIAESLIEYGWVQADKTGTPNQEVFCKPQLVDYGSSNLNSPIDKPPMRSPGDIEGLADSFRGHFGGDPQTVLGIAMPMRRRIGNSIFTSSTGQYFDPVFFMGSNKTPDERVALVQPVIRLKDIKAKPGFTRSFLNLGLIELDLSESDHVQNLDAMMGWFSRIGIYVPDIHIVKQHTSEDWGNGQFDGQTLRLMYGDIELGVANYFAGVPTCSGTRVSYSDISIGAERTQWAKTKKTDYRKIIAPDEQASCSTLEAIDAIRTLTLASLGNIQPCDRSDAGQKMNRLLGNHSKPGVPLDYALIKYCYDFWNKYTHEQHSTAPNHIFSILEQARQRYIAKSIGGVAI